MTQPAPNRPALIWLILASGVVLVFGVAASFVAMFTPMMFDAPGSIENPLLVTLAIYVAAGPLVAVTALGVGWVRVYMGRRYSALKWMLILPIVWIIGLVGWFGALNTFCGGEFSCGA